jgi:hypothetical protein
MAFSLSEEDARGPRRGAKGSCGTPRTPCVSSPGGLPNVATLRTSIPKLARSTNSTIFMES